ncbi:SRPBCC family protein [Halovenus sp. WSH3]|uniref:SRPBCC family protein n=1 Tax=Halovenus carboxidivorans TaxID=2692199 RepID=A0A6B0T565_9EURY|nr:SRPBCC family protein [Halovenus carboxidivorans]MXR50693.1 SRPBCC family protein [Halovenus carboxidivorans]
MRTVELTRQIDASPPVVDRALDPASIVEYEGSFEVFEVERREDDWLVVAGGSGLRLTLRFEERENGFFYEQEAAEGQPLDAMETTITYRQEGNGTRVTAVSEVSMGVRPTAITDRLAAWKRNGELERALDALAAEVE